jgi:L-idonate 5-dehydrogenase
VSTVSQDMLALVVRGPREHALERVPRPIPGPGEALVATTHVALCGTDLRLLAGTLHDADYPVIPGHEWAGRVVAAPDRPELAGRCVVGHNFRACGRCAYCEAGSEQLCVALDELGFTLPGAFAETFCVPVDNLRLLPAGLPGDEACLLEPLCVAMHALERAPQLAGKTVGVIGAGTIGLLVAQLAASAGADVAVADLAEGRRAIAAEVGIGSTEPDLAAWKADPREVVFDATGVASVFSDGLLATKQGGAYVLVGYSGEETTQFQPSLVMLREVTVIGVLSGYGKIDAALDAVMSGAVRLGPLVSDPLPLSEYRAVLAYGKGAAPLRSMFVVDDQEGVYVNGANGVTQEETS